MGDQMAQLIPTRMFPQKWGVHSDVLPFLIFPGIALNIANLKKAGMASRNIVIKKQYMLF